MQEINGIDNYMNTGRSAVTFGKFDGLHQGHQKLVKKVKELGEKDGIKSVVCAFDMRAVMEQLGQKPRFLMTKGERKLHLNHEVDYLVDCPFSEDFAKMKAERFIETVIKGVFHADYVVVGTDFRFGHGKSGDIHMLEAYATQYDYELIVLDKERYEGRIISSTYIRQAMEEGNMPLVNKLLGYGYKLTGVVEHGKKLGRRLGFPTLNIVPSVYKILPPRGVYLCWVYVEGQRHRGIANIGVKPTVTKEKRVMVESYLFDYANEIYGEQIQIELLEFVRPEQKFADVEDMKTQVNKDIVYGEKFFRGEISR